MPREISFRSDNESPAAPEIMAAVTKANEGTARSYGEDEISIQLNEAFSALFETETFVLPLSTGTVANSIALACVTPPWGAVFCHHHAHIMEDESGAPEFFGNGLRLVGLGGKNGKIDPAQLVEALNSMRDSGIHNYLPAALSMTQCTEFGSSYSIGETTALTTIARQHDLATHMDGARFANAAAFLNQSPADLTWRAGIDMLSFGASKNGCFGAEALLFFNQPELHATALRLRKRSGHLLSKMRFVTAQLQAYIADGCWLRMARHANEKAESFAAVVEAHPSVELAHPVESNEVFALCNTEQRNSLEADGVRFFKWPGHDDLVRFVFSSTTQDEDCTQLENILGGL
jgi:threonine aldolase